MKKSDFLASYRYIALYYQKYDMWRFPIEIKMSHLRVSKSFPAAEGKINDYYRYYERFCLCNTFSNKKSFQKKINYHEKHIIRKHTYIEDSINSPK